MNRSRELARILLDKAAQDEFTVRKLVPDPESPDEVIELPRSLRKTRRLAEAVMQAG